MGAITAQNALKWVAPSINADSSISLGISQKKPRQHPYREWLAKPDHDRDQEDIRVLQAKRCCELEIRHGKGKGG